LDRGYAIVSTSEGAVIQDASTVSAGTRIRARLARGSLDCQVVQALPAED
jgi:exonuclease VII large subunit